MQSSNPPTSSGSQSAGYFTGLGAARRRRLIYEAQVRAFVEAAEAVDIDEVTLDDILDGFDGFTDEDPDVVGESSEDFISLDGFAPSASATMQRPEFEAFGDQGSVLPRWTKMETKWMLHHLKEKGMVSFMKEYVVSRAIPIPELLRAFGIDLCEELQKKKPKTLMYFLEVALSRELQMRERLPHINTLDDAIELITNSRRILILTGAGISVSCGIPDFRSRDGLYASLKDKGAYDLDDPQQMFDITYFKENPAVFYSFARQIYPSNFIPSPCHRFIKLVEDNGKLLRNYTQNIDTLETLAGVHNVLQCHGSFATASCLNCRTRVPGTDIETEILQGEVPICKTCDVPGAAKKVVRTRRKRGKRQDSDEEEEPSYPPWVMKPDITFFGEKLTDDFEKALIQDREKVDLLLVIGTSLKVSPVSEILAHMPHSIPQILINKTPVRHINPDIILMGNADSIIEHLCTRLQWDLPPPTIVGSMGGLHLPTVQTKKRRSMQPPIPTVCSHIWLFEGAEGGKWLADFKGAQAAAGPAMPAPAPSNGVSPPSLPNVRDAKRTRIS